MKRLFTLTLFCLFASSVHAEESAEKIIRDAVNYWRGASSYTEASMKIHRPDWEREMGFKGWTKGEELSLVRFTKPIKDSGSSTLVVEKEMWSYSPKISKVVKIPPSMMSQSWMGSDFSHADLSKQNDIINQYTHSIISQKDADGILVYIIESIPKESAAVVWGKEILTIRKDLIITKREFYDQDMKLVKSLDASDIRASGSRKYARIARMTNAEAPNEWTEVAYDTMDFDAKIPDTLFTVSNLKNPT